MSDTASERLDRIEDDVYRMHPENPGAILRLDRIERLLKVMLLAGSVVGGFGLLYKLLDVIGLAMQDKIAG